MYDFCFVIRTKILEALSCCKAFKINLPGLDANHMSTLDLPERWDLDTAFINVWSAYLVLGEKVFCSVIKTRGKIVVSRKLLAVLQLSKSSGNFLAVFWDPSPLHIYSLFLLQKPGPLSLSGFHWVWPILGKEQKLHGKEFGVIFLLGPPLQACFQSTNYPPGRTLHLSHTYVVFFIGLFPPSLPVETVGQITSWHPAA